MTSTQSIHIRDKLNDLGLIKEEDYILTDVRENSKSGPGAPSKHYMLTPDAFKKCLMRAQRRANQPVDPVIYVDYYLLLEKIFKLYGMYQECYSMKLLSMKDDKIDHLIKQNDAQSEQMAAQNAKIDELLARSKETLDTLDDVQEELSETKDDLSETKANVEIVKDHLTKKSKISTCNPKKKQLCHNFAATTFDMPDGTRVVKFTTGTMKHVEKTISKLIAEQHHQIIIPTFYNANGIDLRQNGQAAFKIFLKQRLEKINVSNLTEMRQFNRTLLAEIRAYNRDHPNNKRVYKNEKHDIPKKLKPADIPVKYNLTTFKYRKNPYMSFNEVLKIVIDVNTATQESPIKA